MLDVFRMRNPRMMKRDDDDKKQGAVVLPRRFERIEVFAQNVIRFVCFSIHIAWCFVKFSAMT